MREEHITSTNTDIEVVKHLYETAFPIEEQIPWSDLICLIEQMPLDFTAYYDGSTFIGLTIVYPRHDLNWFWYFAVEEHLRGKGYGQQILTCLINRYKTKPLILDMESPEQPSANISQRCRRHEFYLRNDFHDTGVGRTFDGISYTIMMLGSAPFSLKDYDNILNDLRCHWGAMPNPEQ